MSTSKRIEILAQKTADSQSFDFNTFKEARKTIRCEDLEIEFDCLSLCIYQHNLSKNDYRDYGSYLNKIYSSKLVHDDKKRIEYGVLLNYFILNHQNENAIIEKTERPDFVLSIEGKKIGVEVTKLTTQYAEVLNRIANGNCGQGYTAEQIRVKSIEKHGQKADNYQYYDLENTTAIGTNPYNLNSVKQLYAKHILDKYFKYENDIEGFDEFIILCDCRDTFEITSEYDINEIFDQLAYYNFGKRFTVKILALIENKLTCFEKIFN